jgi:hypothetical protein
MENAWNIIEYEWNMYGICIEYHGVCMEYVWNMYGKCMEYHGICRNMYGICMKNALNIMEYA